MNERELNTLLRRITPIAADVCAGDPDAPVLSGSRLYGYVLARCFIVQALLDNGATYEEAARLIGRNRTSIYHIFGRMMDIQRMPNVYRDDFMKWNTFKQLING